MRYILITTIILLCFNFLSALNYESFDNLNASASTYSSGSFIGNNMIEWHYSQLRKVEDSNYVISPPSAGFSNTGERYLEADIHGGIASLSYQVRSYFTGGTAANRSISVYLNGNEIDNFTLAEMNVVYLREISGIETIGVFNLRIESVGSRHIVIDDIEWYSYEDEDAVAAPTFYPASGTYFSAQTVTISTETANAQIFYTVDGSEPTTNSFLYQNPLEIEETTTLRAKAVKDGNINSSISQAIYRIYYSSVEGKSGDQAWDEIKSITRDNHILLSTNNARDLLYGVIDNIDDKVQCIYTGEWINHQSEGTGTPTGFSREHSFPQSWYADLNVSAEISYADVDFHHLFPARADVNSSRGNNPFDYITTVSTYWGDSNYLSYRGKNSEGRDAFEVDDSFKGNIARGLLYFTVRYYDDNSALVRDDIDMLPVLINWHYLDPVDNYERERNARAYNNQGNRNPFVDRPDFIEAVWGDMTIPAPIISSASNIYATGFVANWNTVSEANSYRIDVSSFSDFRQFITGYQNLSVTHNFTAVDDVANNTNYYYRVKAVASDGRLSSNSAVQTVKTVCITAVPVFNPPGGNYFNSVLVSLSPGTAGSKIYYTLDGSVPTLSSLEYEGTPILLEEDTTIKAIAQKTACLVSSVTTAEYFVGIEIKTAIQNVYANPFELFTKLEYSVSEAGEYSVTVFNINGQRVKSFQNNYTKSALDSVIWFGDNESGEQVASGIYLFKLERGGKVFDTIKVTKIK